ncbi:hypothetical protein EPUL_001062 [Erysiphe pulchra]|uniref:Uncharacterized protein n=1 Tax=Erysiphe pulchra TaxID=225359 RepID=A0A2S4PUU8_9PEZI|nr:hypothetical protein EPUL_001062 [Erysiphe pulchra]
MSSDDFLQKTIVEPTVIATSSNGIVKTTGKGRKRSKNQSLGNAAKKTKFNRKNFENEAKINVETGLNNAFAEMDSQLLADYVAQRTRNYESDLSVIELEDKYISASSIIDTLSWQKPRNLENLPSFLERYSGDVKNLWAASNKNGAPHTIIIACAGLRASEIARSIRKYPKEEAKVAKLFAKHIKLQDAIKFLNSYRTGIAVGTPQRIVDLINDGGKKLNSFPFFNSDFNGANFIQIGALRIDHLKRIVIDASHIDKKKRGILEMKETQVPLIKLLGLKELRDRYFAETDKINLLFF